MTEHAGGHCTMLYAFNRVRIKPFTADKTFRRHMRPHVHMQVVLFVAWLSQQKIYAAVRLYVSMSVAITLTASPRIDKY